MYAGLAPHDALAIYAVIAYLDSVAGVYFPRGGMHAVPRALAGAAEKHGVRDPVRHDGDRGWRPRPAGPPRCITADGERIPADVVVLNPDLPVAYRDLLPGRRRQRRLRYSPSLRGAARRLDARATRRIAHHNIHFGTAWQGTFDEVIDRGRADVRPVAAGHQPEPHRPGGGAGRPADLLRARARCPTSTGPPLDWRGDLGRRYADELIGDAGGARLRRLRRRRRGRPRSITPADWADAGHGRRHPVRRRAQPFPDRPVPPGQPAPHTVQCGVRRLRHAARASAYRWC